MIDPIITDRAIEFMIIKLEDYFEQFLARLVIGC